MIDYIFYSSVFALFMFLVGCVVGARTERRRWRRLAEVPKEPMGEVISIEQGIHTHGSYFGGRIIPGHEKDFFTRGLVVVSVKGRY